ncbi:hypothetical protein MTO98_14975 [Mucilaginibacter sp. SMC90]|uniref:hypothetical protein n=1 Tax=Mucilaginibacter sp. SMC90 TaxID=2929803 RepID=UPI001FB1EE50|nr:hypothetical protein [Mucilaginibacter sp. SMC90]UOE52382.1 hypothetical protein MTO98_14975 [Mucilaginibacter sp. SMC90]
MNDKKFKLLLKVINFLSVVSLEKYWKNGFKIVFKKKKKSDVYHSSEIESVILPVATAKPEKVV